MPQFCDITHVLWWYFPLHNNTILIHMNTSNYGKFHKNGITSNDKRSDLCVLEYLICEKPIEFESGSPSWKSIQKIVTDVKKKYQRDLKMKSFHLEQTSLNHFCSK